MKMAPPEMKSWLRPCPLLGWPENEVTTSSRDAEMNTTGSTSAVNFKQLC